MSTATYAWCFDHGSLHRFLKSEGPWCTASWVELPGWTESEAMAAKERRYGSARFFDELPSDQQIALVEARSEAAGDRS